MKVYLPSSFEKWVSVAYLRFFNQVQQVFDMVSQQVLALPHLIQSSERDLCLVINQSKLKKSCYSTVCHLIGEPNTYLTAFVSRVAYR